MSEAVNNPYKQEAPDKTLSIEGVAADSKAVGDALAPITTRYIGYIGYTGQTSDITYDMSGKSVGLYMACFYRSNRIYLLFMNSDNTLELPEGSDYMSIDGNKVTFKKLAWFDSGHLLRLS